MLFIILMYLTKKFPFFFKLPFARYELWVLQNTYHFVLVVFFFKFLIAMCFVSYKDCINLLLSLLSSGTVDCADFNPACAVTNKHDLSSTTVCKFDRPQFETRGFIYDSQKWVDYNKNCLECYKTHILEQQPRPKSFWNLWTEDVHTLRLNEERLRDISFYEKSLELWENDLKARQLGVRLSEEVNYHTWRNTWNQWLACIVYPLLLLCVWLWILSFGV